MTLDTSRPVSVPYQKVRKSIWPDGPGDPGDALPGGAVQEDLERYTAEALLAPAAKVSAMEQHVHRVALHWHDFYELVHVTGGRASHRVNGVEHDLAPGSTFLLTPADFHEITALSREPLTYVNVVIDPWLVHERFDDLVPAAVARGARMLSPAPELAPDFRRLLVESRLDPPGATQLMQAVVECLLIELSRRRGEEPETPPADRSFREHADVRKAVLFVDHHFREPLTLAGVAAQAHLSPNYFSERFREVTGTSFQSYLQQRRLTFAQSLLASTRLGVTEVCRAAGFNNLSHFGRAYRNRYGVSPTASRSAGDTARATSTSRGA